MANTEKSDFARTVSKNLKKIAYERGKTAADIAQDLHLSKPTVFSWLNGTRIPKMVNIDVLCEYFHCTRDDIIGDSGAEKKRIAVKIPVLGNVAAGIPITAVEDVLDYEEISQDMADNGSYIGLRVKGDSMAPRIMEGDVVIIRIQPDIESGDIAVVRINGDNATCKRVIKNGHGISLVSFNPAYKPMSFTNLEILQTPVEIIGKVVELRGKF